MNYFATELRQLYIHKFRRLETKSAIASKYFVDAGRFMRSQLLLQEEQYDVPSLRTVPYSCKEKP